MKTFKEIVEQARQQVKEFFPWDVDEKHQQNPDLILLDTREEYEVSAFHIKGSMLVPRGILETACEEGYEDAVPELIGARNREIVVICRSGNRSILAAQVMQLMGYQHVSSMKTGLRGWNDFELPLYDIQQRLLNVDDVDERLKAGFCSSIMHPNRRTTITTIQQL